MNEYFFSQLASHMVLNNILGYPSQEQNIRGQYSEESHRQESGSFM